MRTWWLYYCSSFIFIHSQLTSLAKLRLRQTRTTPKPMYCACCGKKEKLQTGWKKAYSSTLYKCELCVLPFCARCSAGGVCSACDRQATGPTLSRCCAERSIELDNEQTGARHVGSPISAGTRSMEEPVLIPPLARKLASRIKPHS